MSVIETNEEINKSMPDPVMLAMIQILRNYGVPVSEMTTWIYAQKALYQQLKAYYDQGTNQTA